MREIAVGFGETSNLVPRGPFCHALEKSEPVVSIQGVSIQTQAVKLYKNFVPFKYSLRVNKKNILGEYLRPLNQVRGTIYTLNE